MKSRDVLLLLLLVDGLAACSKKVEPPRRTEPWLANPSASSAVNSSAPERFRLTRESRVRFSLPTRKARPSGSVSVSGGEIVLDRGQLDKSRANVEVDLGTLVIDESTLPEAADLAGRAASEIALDWLELGAGVPRDERQRYAKARFELVSVESLSAPSFGLEPRTKRVRASVVGTLLLHGFRAPVRADIWLELTPGSNGGPERLSIRSAAPLVLPLGPHDIGARSASGMADPLTAAKAAEWVGKAARLELELEAEPETPPRTTK